MDKMSEKTVEEQAEALAQRRGLDAKPVAKVLRRMARSKELAPSFPVHTVLDLSMSFVEPDRALRIFESADAAEILRGYRRLGYLGNRFTPLYTLDQLAQLLQGFKAHLIRNKDHLLETGHQKSSYCAFLWLDYHCNKLYFTKLPAFSSATIQIENPDDCLPSDDLPVATTARFDAEHNLIFDYKWSREVSSTPGWLRKGMPFCDYDDAPVLGCFEREESKLLEDVREKVLEAKIAVIERLQTAARRGSIDRLWIDVLNVLTDKLTYEEANNLAKLDVVLRGNGDRLSRECSSYVDPLLTHNAGFTDLLEVAGHIEKEATLGTMQTTRQELNEYPLYAEHPHGTVLPSYFEIYDEPWRPEVDRIMQRFIELEKKEQEFWNAFDRRARNALADSFRKRVPFSYQVRSRFEEDFRLKVNNFAHYLLLTAELTGSIPELVLPPAVPEKRGSVSKQDSPLPTMKNLEWKEVTIEFVSNDSVRIKARDFTGRFTWGDLGLKDNRIGDSPRYQWDILRAFAEGDGVIGPNNPVNKKSLYKDMQVLKKALSAFFGVDESPIKHYRKHVGYVTRFKISDLRYGRD